ncbi:Rrf2 family transcriptional regulator [Thioclava sp. SK-1]|uniref:RrF2 family transcriptional regulator n=1 Tax=Thioclava sp. SK-1 TaxID=1889770 RepID=UPI000826674D|nr:Rrf2 family transcriptional regulator [Thioclava sp. SK-1]OCX62073.1 Rrf2 family transcriptional regulator [Thioclava sp. SK-1]
MRLTTRSNLALRTLMFCAVNADRVVRKHEVARLCNASENHLAQVVHQLATHGFINTLRGRSGGLRLARPITQITVGQVLRVFESPLPLAECFDPATNTCPLSSACLLRLALHQALDAFYAALDQHSLSDLVANNSALEMVLQLPATPTAVIYSKRGEIKLPA